ncbi:MAG: SxtJ family membrane protein [Verrucomicrobia bacterium]|nr:SxtJ family membrane protein [Verrucomicrobiota bacterium]
MELKLKENPKEWQKFTASLSALVAVVAWLAHRRGLLPVPIWLAWTGLAGIVLTALAQPRWFRGFYRIGMTVGFHIGQTLGKLLLVAIYILIVTPTGLLLRAMGKDLLSLKRKEGVRTYWQPTKKNTDFDRQF